MFSVVSCKTETLYRLDSNSFLPSIQLPTVTVLKAVLIWLLPTLFDFCLTHLKTCSWDTHSLPVPRSNSHFRTWVHVPSIGQETPPSLVLLTSDSAFTLDTPGSLRVGDVLLTVCSCMHLRFPAITVTTLAFSLTVCEPLRLNRSYTNKTVHPFHCFFPGTTGHTSKYLLTEWTGQRSPYRPCVLESTIWWW